MNAVRNISKSKVTRFLLGLVLVCLFLSLLIASSFKYRNEPVKDIHIQSSQDHYTVVTIEEIKNILTSNPATNFRLKSIKDLDLELIEKTIEQNAWIQNAEVYVDNKEQLQLQLTQNSPVARIFSQNGVSYYLDTASTVLPNNVAYPYPTPVFTNVPYLGKDEVSRKYKACITYLGNIISQDSFWNAQITQIAVLPDMTFEMATLMGDHKIQFGDTSRAKEKLNNLFIFYKDGLSKLGWDRYTLINVSYAGQVIASPAMGYIAPIVEDTMVALPDEENVASADKPVVNNTAAALSPAKTGKTPATGPVKKETAAKKNTVSATVQKSKPADKKAPAKTVASSKKTDNTKKTQDNKAKKQNKPRLLPPKN